MTQHAVVNIDNMSAVYDDSKVLSAKFYVGSTETAIENGNVVALGALVSGEKEIYTATAPIANTQKVYLVATPELIYDQSVYHNIDEFINEAGVPIRVLELGGIFSVTAEAFVSVPTVGQYIVPTANGTKMTAVNTVTTEYVIGKCVEIFSDQRYTYYAIKQY